LAGRGLLRQRLVTFGSALSNSLLRIGKLALQIGVQPSKSSQRAVAFRAHLRTSGRPPAIIP